MKKAPELRNKWRAELNHAIQEGQIELPEALVQLRKVLGKSQLEYAELVGVSKKVITDFELGKGNPTLATVNRLFAPMGLRIGLIATKR